MPVLQTPRLSLREFEPEDLDALATILSDPETIRYYPAPLDSAGVADWIQRNRTRYAKDGHGLLAMTLNSSGELIGDCGLVHQNVDGADEIEIGYHVRRDLWGQGLPRKPPVLAETTDSRLSELTGSFPWFARRTLLRDV
jgi:ribosomal-protein-alanine N-acetyltransferase